MKQPNSAKKLTNIRPEVTNNQGLFTKLSITYLHTEAECFSNWQKLELKKFSAFINKVNKKKINELSGGGLQLDHSGDAMDKKVREYMRKNFSQQISPDIIDGIIVKHLRIDQGIRVHGYFENNTFHIIRLDRNHGVNKS